MQTTRKKLEKNSKTTRKRHGNDTATTRSKKQRKTILRYPQATMKVGSLGRINNLELI